MRWIIFAIVLFSCGEVNHKRDFPEREIPEDCNEVWICWNPSRSDLHLRRCTEECYVEGDSTKYCFFDHCE